jgi:uncharacterized membrane protein
VGSPMQCPWLLLALIPGLSFSSRADEPAKKYQVLTIKDDGIEVTGMNARGDLVGFEWAEEKGNSDIISQKPFYAKGKEMTYLPLLKTYTATFPASVSDEGVVVGRVSKAAPPGVRVFMRNQAFVWDPKNGIRGLGVLKDDFASLATGISRDGRRISGYSLGDNRVRACVWDKDGDGWKGVALPHELGLRSNVVAISDDGKYVSAVDGVVPCLWTEDASGQWTRKVLGDSASLVPRAVNNSGAVVGLRFSPDGKKHAVVCLKAGEIQQLDELKGYDQSEANAVNNQGEIVGLISGPSGPTHAPKGFVYFRGQLRLLDEAGPNFSGATAINDKGQVAGVMEKDDEAEKPAPIKKP